jgi:hypothetical protein
VSGRVSSIINDCKRTRRDEGLFKRIIFTRNRRHYERGDGCGTRVTAGPHQFDTRAVHSGDHPSHCERWRKRPSYFAADGAVGAADCAARLTYHKRYPDMKKPTLRIEEQRPRNIQRADIAPSSGYAIVVDGHFKTEFSEESAAKKAARELLANFPMLRVEIYNAPAKTLTLMKQ